MFIGSLERDYPGRVLKSIRADFAGFQATFDLPIERRLQIEISVFVKDHAMLEVYEHIKGSEPGRYWLTTSNHYDVSGADPLPLLETYLQTAIGGVEHGYEGSFAEVLLRSIRSSE